MGSWGDATNPSTTWRDIIEKCANDVVAGNNDNDGWEMLN